MSDIIIYGRGKTGHSLAKMMQELGQSTVFYDDNVTLQCDAVFKPNSTVVVSPGVFPTAIGVQKAKNAGCKLVGELQFCLPYLKGKCVSVTGTNGKTTTCEMLFHILQFVGKKCYLLGNGGVPLSQKVLSTTDDGITVLESSSFQLKDVVAFQPTVSVFTSLASDHVNYHGSLQQYVGCKLNNFVWQRAEQFALFNMDDGNVVELSQKCPCKKLFYSAGGSVSADCYFDGRNVVICNENGSKTWSASVLSNYAKHNVGNALAAILSALILGVSVDQSLRALHTFVVPNHRLQQVAKLGNIAFVNDSKATNVHATTSALGNYSNIPVALILGGYDKGESFAPLFGAMDKNVCAVAAIGQTANKIWQTARGFGRQVALFDSLCEAVRHCYETLQNNANGGVVLMSNACASFDAYASYRQRGEAFCSAVEELLSAKKAN